MRAPAAIHRAQVNAAAAAANGQVTDNSHFLLTDLPLLSPYFFPLPLFFICLDFFTSPHPSEVQVNSTQALRFRGWTKAIPSDSFDYIVVSYDEI